MSFQQGLSGLNASAASLNVIGNNVANVATVGFKRADAHFSDLYAASLGIGSGSQIGIGVTVSAIQQQFTQGNLTTTSNPLDLALNGPGYFRMSHEGAITYTRNGQFHLDKEGYVINDKNLRLTGYPVAENGDISPTNPVEIQLSASQIPPRATSDPLAGDISAVINLDALDPVPLVTTFDPANTQSYNFSTALNVFDTLGVMHNLSTYYVRTATPGTWDVYATLDGVLSADAAPGGRSLVFDTTGVLTSVVPAPAAGDPVFSIPMPEWDLTDGATTPWSPGSIDYTDTTQFGNDSTVDRLIQGGYAAGSLVGVGVSRDGILQGRYSNSQSRNLGQVVLANFSDPNGLLNLGNNEWSETSTSGPPLLGAPGTGTRAVIQSATVEDSNVDLTKELVDMISAQRNYQANAQTIKTQDQVMQTLVNLR
ncbi:MAG: flagellar hook protein FlgE [Accumulibacter sp.]|jgi:flagellar hook protein FlgE|uniref:flagellar hook protein FlgE n=1 Tax=Accumulibacter sp. TaxID=2053492 RepID=UPI002FC288F5